jgi:TonB-linked SusC/RagA family outer membrane protein
MKRLFYTSDRGIPKLSGKMIRFGTLLLMLITFSLVVNAQPRQVTGTVIDTEGEPVIGATVTIQGTTRGVVTDIAGKYGIECTPDQTLVFSFVGMVRQTVLVGSQSVINITFQASPEAMDEVIVIGYGAQKKESVVGAIAQVAGEKLLTVKMGGSVENTLQGRLPGLTVFMTDPTPGEEALGGYYAAAPITMAIRGASSMTSNAPLVIVDGVERPFSHLDPNEIESVSILKDASATAVYGVKGANGVIIINTKRGRVGSVQLDFSTDLSVKVADMLPEYMNAYNTMLLRNEAWKNDGMWNLVVSDEVLEHYRTHDLPYLYPDFDWMKYYFKPGFDQTYNLNARGGNEFVKYFVSLAFLGEGDIYAVGNDFPYQYDRRNAHYWHNRYNFRNNLDFNITKSTVLSVNLGGNIKVWNKPQDWFTQEQMFEPVTVMPWYPVEALEQYPDNLIPWDQNTRRPMIKVEQGEVRMHWIGGQGFYRFKSNELNSDIRLTQKLDFITRGLSISGLYSYNGWQIYRQDYNYPYGQFFGYYLSPETLTWTRTDPWGAEDLDTPPPRLEVNNPDNLWKADRSHYYEFRLSFDRSFGNHNVSAVGLFSRRQSAGIPDFGVVDFPHYEENWVGRATYSFAERYFFEGSIAYTGSEKFAPGLRFGTFPAFGVGWMISNESFFNPVKKVMNLFKLRYSYGIVGSDAGIDRWLYVSEYTPASGAGVSFGFPMQNYSYITEGNIPVIDATWEEAKKQNLGIDLGFFQNLITLTVDLFNEKREKMLQSRQTVPSWVGVSAIQGNIGSTKSHGMEILLGINKQIGNNAYLMASANVSLSENRVVFYDESASVPFNLKVEGKPVDIARRGTIGLEDGGFYQDFDELFMWPRANYAGGPIVGDLKFLDFNGDGNVDEQDYVVAEDPTVPNVTWNAQLGGGYKNWSFDVNFYGISKTSMSLRQGGMFYLFPFAQNKDNAYTAHANHWTPTNTDPEFPAVHYQSEDQYNYQISNYSMIPGRYFRLRSARINYKLEMAAFSKIGLEEVNLAFIGSNLWTWRERKWGGDPEGFNYGVDFGAYPQMKRFTLEIRATF